MSMALFCSRKQNLSWQDRTINVEVMMAPTRAQLLYNKHKGLGTKCRQESSNLEREKSSYLRSFRTDVRLMERKKDMYARRKNDIQVRRQSADSRRRSVATDGGRKSAPPRLEQDEPRGDNTFLTQLDPRDSKSAEPSINTDSFRNFHRQTPDRSKLNSANRGATPVTPSWSTPTPVIGKPYLKLERQKSVRFRSIYDTNKSQVEEEKPPAEMTLEDRIKRFMETQVDFNKRETMSASYPRGSGGGRKTGFADMTRRRSSTGASTSMIKLENAFNDFCSDKSRDGLSKLVKYASKMRDTLKNTRTTSIVPPLMGGNSKIPIIRA